MKSPQVKLCTPVETHANYSDLQVLQSPAGFYIGTIYTDPKTGCQEPGSRDSGYFPTREAAETALTSDNFEQRKTP